MLAIRPALRDDAWGVARVHEIARSAYYGVEPAAEVDPERVGMWWSFVAERRRFTVLVVEDDEEIVAFISYGSPLHVAAGSVSRGTAVELHALYVLPDHWSSGVGSVLHQRFTEHLAQHPGTTGTLEVWEGNARALTFYERRGWRRDGRRRSGHEGLDYVGMSLRPGR